MVVEYRVNWSIPNAGPSQSTFYVTSASEANATQIALDLRRLYFTLQPGIPNEVTVSFEPTANIVDTPTGQITAQLTVSPPADVVGTAAGTWAAGTGARIDWLTSRFLNGRNVRGRTFIVPLAANSFGSDGRVLPGSVANLTTAGNNLIDDLIGHGTALCVYSRPAPGRPGTLTPVEIAAGRSLPATLRGRKY